MPMIEFSSPFITHATLLYTLNEGMFPWTTRHVQKKRFRRQRSVQPSLPASNRILSAQPEEWFPCCITAERTVTITIWTLLMIFTFTLRFLLWKGGTTCTLPDKSVHRGGREVDSTGLCLEYSPPPAVLWMDGRVWWVSPLSCPVVVGNIDQSSWRMLKLREGIRTFGPRTAEALVCMLVHEGLKGKEKGQFIM